MEAQNNQILQGQVVGVFAGGISSIGDAGHSSGIRKQPQHTAVEITLAGITGDQIVDRRYHGGSDKALHAYPLDNYARLQAQFPQQQALFVPGSIGENLSIQGFNDQAVWLGDIFQLGTTLIQVTQNRSPCWKISARYDIERLSIWIEQQRIMGWYMRVLQPGKCQSGDNIVLIERDPLACSLVDAWDILDKRRPSLEQLNSLLQIKALSVEWQNKIQQRLAYLAKNLE